MKFYMLPDGCDLPKLSRKDPVIQRHQSIGYGYPLTHYEDFKGKSMPIQLDLSQVDFKEKIRSLYTRLANKDFEIFTVSQQRELAAAPFNPPFYKEQKYQGTVIIKILDVVVQPQVPIDTETDMTADSMNSLPDLPPIQRNNPNPRTPRASTQATATTPAATVTTANQTQSGINLNTEQNRPRTPQRLTSTPSASSVLPDEWISSGTPLISANPRSRLIMEQDIDFAASLAIDREKEDSRQQARVRRILQRTERQRLRDTRKEELEKIHLEVIEEISQLRQQSTVDDLVTIVLVLPDQKEIRKTVSKQTKSETLHLYVEATTEIVSAKLIYCGQVLGRQQQPLASFGITGSCRMNVEEAVLEESDESDFDEVLEAEPVKTLHISDIADLEERRKRVQSALLPSKKVTVKRENIVEDLMDQYRLHPDTVHHRLEVVFEGEEAALDVQGVTREMFSCFFYAMIVKFFFGHCHKIPTMDHRHLFNGTYEVIGKIISHAFILCNYIPTTLSPVVYILAGTGCVSDALLLTSFMQHVNEAEKNLIKHLMSANNFVNMQEKLFNLVSSHGGRELPTTANFKRVITDIARTTLIAAPLYPISCIKKGMDCYPLLWQGASETVVVNLLEQYHPTADKIINKIHYNHSEEPTLNLLEERAKNYFEHYIMQLNKSQINALLRFWTSADTLCIEQLEVSFNSTEGLQRRPIANTCAATLQISRLYFSNEDLSQEFDIYLSDSSSKVFDSV
ncbi:uncharacterized protein LOC134718705 [Mytilus trossulus]|uniref:uncharacterized protein LOC134718705 n=1 Tax=Mytilus trossulus TaxID=6551 RepID=UPI00300739D1